MRSAMFLSISARRFCSSAVFSCPEGWRASSNACSGRSPLSIWRLASSRRRSSVSRSVQDLFEPLLDVLEDGGEVVAVERLAALLAQLLEQVAQALHAVAEGIAHAALQQVAQRVLQVAEVHQVVGQRVEDIVGVERRDLLRAVPFGVAEAEVHGDIIWDTSPQKDTEGQGRRRR